jgi:membrane-associated HD superfamily phosphohydrolase
MAQQRQSSSRKDMQDARASEGLSQFDKLTSKLREATAYIPWLFIVTMMISAVCFVRNDCLNVQFIPGNLSKTTILAEVPFEFESKVKTRKLYEQKRREAGNVYAIDEGKYEDFIRMLKILDERIESFSYESVMSEQGRNDIKEFTNGFNAAGPIKIEWQDIALIIVSLGQIERTQIFQECVSILHEIAKDGVYLDDPLVPKSDESFIRLYGFKIKGRQQQRVRTQEDAVHYARTHILSLELDRDVATIFFKILKQGIKPNLVYDAEESRIDANIIARAIKPIIVKRSIGDVVLEKDTVIDQEAYEIFVEH